MGGRGGSVVWACSLLPLPLQKWAGEAGQTGHLTAHDPLPECLVPHTRWGGGDEILGARPSLRVCTTQAACAGRAMPAPLPFCKAMTKENTAVSLYTRPTGEAA